MDEHADVDCDGCRCRRSTPRDDGSNGAHKDPLTNEAAFISKLHFFLHYLCCMAQSALLR